MRRYAWLVAVVVLCAAAVTWGTAHPGTARAATPVPDDYQFSTGFSTVQGRNQWYYLQWNGSAYTQMSWDPANTRWQGNCTFCIIGQGWAHPDVNDAVIAWQAPKAGTVVVRGTVDHRGSATAPGDGVRAVVMQQSGAAVTAVWPTSGYQIVRPNFMAQHVFTVTVAAGDFLYFHLNKAGSTNNDTTHWDPRVTYGYQPKFTLGPAELMMSPTDFQNMGVPLAQDASLAVVPDGTGFDFYHSGGQSATVSKFRGSLAQPAQHLVYAKNVFGIDLNAGERWWIANTYQAPGGGLLAFCHIENADVNTTGWWALGLAYSSDNGQTFTRLGKIVTQHVKDDGSHSNIYGVPYVVDDGYFYVYFGDVQSAQNRSVAPAVARAPVAEVLAAAAHGTVTTWQKYFNGGWTEAGLGGSSTPVIGDGTRYAVHGDAAYSTYLGRYLLSGYTGQLGKGVFLAFSDDGTSFDVPNWIQSSDTTAKDSLSPYETIVNVDGSDNGVVGQSFYVYYSYRFRMVGVTDADYPAMWRWLYRQKVTLNKAGFDRPVFAAGPDYTSKMGENNWYYLQYNGASYAEMSWSDGQFRWNGSAPDLSIGATTQHPDGGQEAVRAWVAPRSGTVHIAAADIAVGAGTGADGVQVRIIHNGPSSPVWPAGGYQSIAAGGTAHFDGADVTVNQNDRIYFAVNQNGNSTGDTVEWSPVVSYQ